MKIVDLFCGCGGMSYGFSLAGFEVTAGIDNWDKAIEVYRANFDHPTIKADLSDLRSSTELIRSLHPDMIIGGPPCQDFSSAGKRDEEGGRGNLTVCYANIIANIKPKWFVMENVALVQRTNKFIEAKSIFEKAGYALTSYTLDASRCNVPQARKRFILVGKLGEKPNFLLPFIIKNLSKSSMTVRQYLGDELNLQYYYRHPRSYARRGVFSIDEPSPTIRGVNRPMPVGYKLHKNDPVNSLKGIRNLTTYERSRIQTFPKTFKFFGTKTDQEQMIGNAVPVNLGLFIGKTILDYIAFNEAGCQDQKERAIDVFTGVQLNLFDRTTEYESTQ